MANEKVDLAFRVDVVLGHHGVQNDTVEIRHQVDGDLLRMFGDLRFEHTLGNTVQNVGHHGLDQFSVQLEKGVSPSAKNPVLLVRLQDHFDKQSRFEGFFRVDALHEPRSDVVNAFNRIRRFDSRTVRCDRKTRFEGLHAGDLRIRQRGINRGRRRIAKHGRSIGFDPESGSERAIRNHRCHFGSGGG